MRALSIQVQPERSPGIDLKRLDMLMGEIVALSDLVKHHAFDGGTDHEVYPNFTFGTPSAASLWNAIWSQLYEDSEIGLHLMQCSMAMCSSDSGWDEYLQLFHFDPDVACDDASSLQHDA